MVIKPVVYSDHARRQMANRAITRQDVRWLIACGERTATDNASQYWATGRIGRRDIGALVIEDGHRYFIRTVMWIPEED